MYEETEHKKQQKFALVAEKKNLLKNLESRRAQRMV